MDCPTENMTIDRVLAWNELFHIRRPDREAWSPPAQHTALSTPLGSLSQSHLSKTRASTVPLLGPWVNNNWQCDERGFAFCFCETNLQNLDRPSERLQFRPGWAR